MQYSIVNYKKIRNDEDSFRFDAEHYQLIYLNIKKKLEDRKHSYLSDILSKNIVTGHTPSMAKASYYGGNIAFVKTDNVREHTITKNFNHFLTEEGNKIIKRSQLRKDDILLTIIGANFDVVGRSSLVLEDILPANINQNIALIRIDKNKYNPESLCVYLNSYYGRNYLYYLSRQTEQVNLNNKEVEKLLIPTFAKQFSDLVQSIVHMSYQQYTRSQSFYSQAEQLLLSELGLLDWKPKHTLSFVKNYSDTQKAERIDAEYFQPKYEEIVEAVKRYQGGFDTIFGQFKQNKKSFKVVSDEDYQYVEIGCVNISDGSIESIQLQGSELPVNAKIKLQINDIIVSKVRPYRGAIGIVNNDDYVGSGAFTVLQENGVINKETLMTYLRLKPLLDFSLKFNTGTSYPTITDEDILDFYVPKIDSEIQKQIKQKITDMYEMKKTSKSLLEIAKRGVEMAIEEDEKKATEWINGQVKDLNY